MVTGQGDTDESLDGKTEKKQNKNTVWSGGLIKEA